MTTFAGTLAAVHAALESQFAAVLYTNVSVHKDFQDLHQQGWLTTEAGRVFRGTIQILDYQGAGESATTEFDAPDGTELNELEAWIVDPARDWNAVLSIRRFSRTFRTAVIEVVQLSATNPTTECEYQLWGVFKAGAVYQARRITNPDALLPL